MSRSWMIVGIGTLVLAGLVAAGVVYYERPVTLTVAVSPADAEDFSIVNAAAKLLQQRHAAFRFRVLPTDDITASSSALDEGRADLAVVRADVAMPSKGGTVLLTHKDAGVLLAPDRGEVTRIEDLAGERVGLLSSRPGDAKILDIELAQYGVPASEVTVVPLNVHDIQSELAAKSVAAVFAVGPVTEGLVPSAVQAVTAAGNGPPVFLPVTEAPAIVQRMPVYESVDVIKGTFVGALAHHGSTGRHAAEGAAPLPLAQTLALLPLLPSYEALQSVGEMVARSLAGHSSAAGLAGGSKAKSDEASAWPAKDFKTLGVTYRLVASTSLGDHTVAALTRFLLTQRVALTQIEPSAARIETPSTAKGQAQPVHTGTAEYIDDKEETFLEQYSDFIYLGAMLIGVGASGITALLTRIGASGAARVEDLIAHLVAVMKLVRTSKDMAELDNLNDEVDGIVAAALEESCFRTMDERRVAALNMAVEQARSAIRDRRKELRHSVPASVEAAPIVFDPTAGTALSKFEEPVATVY